jgi:hypothetical protein
MIFDVIMEAGKKETLPARVSGSWFAATFEKKFEGK